MIKRQDKDTQLEAKDKRIAELEEQLAQALATIQKLQKQVERLQARVEELERAGRRQAAPFARRKLVACPQKAGRKAGKGQFAHREKPDIKQVNKTKTAELHGCPECGSNLQVIRQHEQFEVDIPEVQPVITRFVTYSGYCNHCHKRVRSQHPEQTSRASGAAGVVVGPRAKGLAADLKHRLGVSYGKVSEVLSDAFGLQVSRSGWCQADQKLASVARPVYEELVEGVQQSDMVNVDETGWRIGILSAWLWVFTNQEMSVYVIRANRSSDVVIDVLGKEFKGILVSDCFLAYDDRRLRTWLKQKCVGHLLKELKVMKESKSGRALHFARQLTAILQEALKLKADKSGLDPFTFCQHALALEDRLDALIEPGRRFSDRDNARFAKRMRKHRPHLLRFMYVDGLEATNNQAERMLRPAVITRKTNGCNRAQSGAVSHAILSSVLVTCRQHSVPILEYLVQLQRFGASPPPLIPAYPILLASSAFPSFDG